MSNMKLKGDSKALFGNQLPAIFIDKIELLSTAHAGQTGRMIDAAEIYIQQRDLAGLYSTFEEIGIPMADSPEDYVDSVYNDMMSGASSATIFHAQYSCYITFDKEKTKAEINDILIHTDIGQINLFTILNPVHFFNVLLEQNKLPLYDLVKSNYTPLYMKSAYDNLSPVIKAQVPDFSATITAVEDLTEEISSILSLTTPQIQTVSIERAILDNQVTDRTPKGDLEKYGFIIEDFRDSEGNLVVRIPFKNSFAYNPSSILGTVGSLNLSLLATASTADMPLRMEEWHEDGRNTDDWITPSMGGYASEYDSAGNVVFFTPNDRSTWRNVFNSYFGDITYQKIFHQGSLVDPYEDIFIYAIDEEPYADTPMQALNGEYYATSAGTTQKKLTEILTTLIAQYEEFRDPETGDNKLNANVSRLELIMERHGEATSILYSLQEYLQRYPEKSSIVLAGKFYGEMKKILFNFNKQVRQGKRVKKVLTLNPVVSDLRTQSADSFAHPPDLSLAGSCRLQESGPGGTEGSGPTELPELDSLEMTDSNYIPRRWHIISRNTRITIPWGGTVGDYMEYLAEEGIGGSDLSWADHNPYGRSDDFWGGTEGEDYWKKGNTIVQNKGYWFFDYEKAAHALSRISKVFNVSKLEKFLNYKIPYEYFRMMYSTQIRRELTFTVNNETHWGGDESASETQEFVYCHLNTMFDTSVDYPISWAYEALAPGNHPEYMMPVVYGMDSDIDTSSIGALGVHGAFGEHSTGDYDISDSLKHQGAAWGPDIGAEWLHIATLEAGAYAQVVPNPGSAENLEHADKSYLKFINVDFPVSNEEARLSNYNGSAVSNGYRVAAFEYVDFMDDDVAFYNTFGLQALDGSFNAQGDGDESYNSRYYMTVAIKDRTSACYIHIYNLCQNAYNGFMKYYDIIGQIGSIDVETDRFTRMFKEGITGLYATPESQPWTRAAYIYEAMRHILYDVHSQSSTGTFGPIEAAVPASETAATRENILQAAASWEAKIGPATGSRHGAAKFRHAFLLLLNELHPQTELAQAPGDDTSYMSEALDYGLVTTGEVYGENPAYDKMMSLVYPELAWDDPAAINDEGLLFSMLDRDSIDVTLRGQKTITEPIYGNLLTSAMGQDQYVSTAAIPDGASQLERSEVRIRLQMVAGEDSGARSYARGVPRITQFFVGMVNHTMINSNAAGLSYWNVDKSNYVRTWFYWDGHDPTMGATEESFTREAFDERSEWVESYPPQHYVQNQVGYSGIAGWGSYSSYEASEPVNNEIANEGVVVDLDKWRDIWLEQEARGQHMIVAILAQSLHHDNPDNNGDTYTQDCIWLEMEDFFHLFGRRLASTTAESSAYTMVAIDDHAPFRTVSDYGNGHFGRQAVGDQHGQWPIISGYTYPQSANQVIVYYSPWMWDGSYPNGRSTDDGGKPMAFGPLATERAKGDTDRAGYGHLITKDESDLN